MTTAVPTVYSFPGFSGVAEAVADLIVTAQNKALSSTATAKSSSKLIQKEKDRRFKISISGGSLINILNEGLIGRDDIQWDKWDIYFSDERLVPFDSPESNYGQATTKLFNLIESDKRPNIFPICEGLISDPQECADDYEKTLIKGFASKDSVKIPLFDLILLGCAPDGHVASLFPEDYNSLREQHAWCIPVENAPVGPSTRISLSIPVICHSHLIAFVVEGSTKAPVLSTIMERPDKGLPASIINERAAGKVAWFVDKDAIADVVGITKKQYKFTAKN